MDRSRLPFLPVPARPPVLSLRALRGLLRRPDLWGSAARTGWLLSAPGWWHRWPPLPRLPPFYEEFRRQTMFGSQPGAELDGDDLVAYLEWCRGMRRLR